jgi:hypothetical protein
MNLKISKKGKNEKCEKLKPDLKTDFYILKGFRVIKGRHSEEKV